MATYEVGPHGVVRGPFPSPAPSAGTPRFNAPPVPLPQEVRTRWSIEQAGRQTADLLDQLLSEVRETAEEAESRERRMLRWTIINTTAATVAAIAAIVAIVLTVVT